jgi:hypothetical protein
LIVYLPPTDRSARVQLDDPLRLDRRLDLLAAWQPQDAAGECVLIGEQPRPDPRKKRLARCFSRSCSA